MSVIEIENTGPIEKLEIPLPENGGVVVLRGRNGVGKSKALEAIDRLTAGKGKPEPKDGEKHGSVSGLGVTLTVAKAIRAKGVLEVESLEGRLSLAELVDPGIKDHDAADAKRIKAIIALADVEPEIGLLVADTWSDYITQQTIESPDLLTMAQRAKSNLEAGARDFEKAADDARIDAEAARKTLDGIEVVEIDEDDLRGHLRAAERGLMELEAQQRQEAEAVRRWEEQQAELAELKQSVSTLVDVYESVAVNVGEAVRKWFDERNKLDAEITTLENRLKEKKRFRDQAVEKLLNAETDKRNAEQNLTDARAKAEYIAKLESVGKPTIDEAIPKKIEQNQKAIDQFTAKLQQVPIMRRAKEAREAATVAELERKNALESAEELREAAKAIDAGLSKIVSGLGVPLRVKDFRLVTETHRGPNTLYADLSAGERWRIALDLAVSIAGTKTLFTVPQECWEGLDPVNRGAIAKQAEERGVTIITAECSEDEIVTA